MDGVTLAAGVLILVGLAGIVVPVLPGLVLVWGAVLIWALERQEPEAWAGLAVATLIFALGMIAKYLIPGRRLREAGVPGRTLFAGAVLAVVGFFIVPVIGIFLGFILGIYLAEAARLHGFSPAWAATKAALGAVGWSMVIELGTGVLIAYAWVLAVVAVNF